MDRLRPVPPVPRLHRAGPALCPVTALAFFRHPPVSAAAAAALYVLAAEDNHLAVYPAAASSPCCGRVRVFAEQAIHGCFVGGGDDADDDQEGEAAAAAGPGHVLVWGGRSVALVSRARLVRVIERGEGDDDDDDGILAGVAPDWILDGRLLPGGGGGGGDGGALVTAHNAVVPFHVRDSAPPASPQLHLAPATARIAPSRPMLLYSARLAWVSAAEAGAAADGDGDGEEEEEDDDDDDSNGRRPLPARLLVAAGTVFGEIVVWTCRLPRAGARLDPQIRLRGVFAGHEGSIFGVALSAPVVLSGSVAAGPVRVRLMATCSDDRTVRIWPLPIGPRAASPTTTATPPATSIASIASIAHAARETGFHNTLADASVPATATAAALAVAMGHTSRIWAVRFGPSAAAAAAAGIDLLLYSFGEDATAQTWRCTVTLGRDGAPDGSTAAPRIAATLMPLRTVAGHAGKSIWSAAVAPVGGSGGTRTIVATGGCDGRIGVFFSGHGDDPSSGTRQGQLVASTVPADDDAQAPPSAPRSSRAHDTFVSFAFLAPDRLLATTSRGRLLAGRLGAASLHWTAVPGVAAATAAALQGYSVVRSPCGGGGGGPAPVLAPSPADLAVVGSADGRLFVYAAGRLAPLTTRLPGGKKVDEVFFLPASPSPSPSSETGVVVLSVLVTGLFHDEAVLLDVDVDTAALAAAPLVRGERSQRLLLPRSAAAQQQPLTVTAASRCGGMLVVGFKTGRLCLYRGSGAGDGHDPETMVLVAERPRAARDAVLAIVPLPAAAAATAAAFVVTARDGTYRIYAVEGTPPAVRVRLQHETAPPFGPIVRDAWFVPAAGGGGGAAAADLVLCGFRSTQFVVWNETHQQALAAVDCGGTHRAHTYCCTAGRLRFAFTRSGQLAVFAQDLAAASASASTSATLKPGGHGREIRAVRTSPGGAFLATGGEDTVVRIWGRWHGDGNGDGHGLPPCLAVLKRHNTGLHALAWLGDDCLVSAAGAEELYVWRLARLDGDGSSGSAAAAAAAYRGLAVRCEAAFPPGAGEGLPKPDRKAASSKILRITALDATSEAAGTALVSVALSNSVLKTYRYTPPPSDDDASPARAGTWTLLAQGRYTGACPTALQHLASGGGLAVLAAFADGHLTVWRAPGADDNGDGPEIDYVLVSATQAHRNAIKSLAVHPVSSATAVVVTGGDDNALAVTGLAWPPRPSAGTAPGDTQLFRKTYRVARAHAAAVTGIQLLGGASENDETASITAVSCSNDQRLKAWRILVRDDAAVRVQLLDDQYSAIADPGALDAVPGGDAVVVVGMGMETWQLGGE